MDKYGKRALDFVEDMQRTSVFADICSRVLSELRWFGLDFVTVADLVGPGADPHEGVFLNTRPADYNENYVRKDYVHKDPVMLALRHELQPFAWNDVRKQNLTRAQHRIIDEGREFGATDGLMIPIHTLSGRMSIFSPCGRDPNLSPRAKSAIEMIGIYSYQALQRALIRNRRSGTSTIPLTAREREVLTWVACGKSDDEIGTILGISRDTVTSYVENAKRKLDATKRIYAVVQALRTGEINL